MLFIVDYRDVLRMIAFTTMSFALLSNHSFAEEGSKADNTRQVPEIKWDTAIKKFQFDAVKFVGQRLSVKCPPAPIGQSFDGVFGTDSYPSDSPIYIAALHAGAITEKGGTITLQLNPGEKAYKGSTRNGVISKDRPSTRRSITFVTPGTIKQNDKLQLSHIPRIQWDTKFTASGFAHRHLIGQQFTFQCPPVPRDLKPRIVYGTDSYAFSSLVCRAALHAGRLKKEGGLVTVQIDKGVPQLVGSIRNGVETKSKRGSDRSLSFVDFPAPEKYRTAKPNKDQVR